MLSRCQGHWDVVAPSAVAASVVLPGIAMVAAGHGNAANAGSAMIIMTLIIWLPYLIGYVTGARKRQEPMRRAIREIHAGTGRVERALAGVMPESQDDPRTPDRRRLTVVGGSKRS